MSNLDFLDEEIEKPSVFIDESKLSAEYLPNNLFHRIENLKSIARHFRGLFSPIRSTRRMIVTGSVGTGKTSIAKTFGLWAQTRARNEGVNIKYVHINCRRNRTPFMILLAITRELNSHVPTRGYSADELMEMIVELLEVKQSTMLLVLDEIDYAVDRGSEDLLYALTRTSDDKQDSGHRIALLLIARSTNFLSRLDQSTSSSLSAAIMQLSRYTKSQLIDIIDDRVKQSFVFDSVTNDSILLAAEIAAIKGDARQALEIMWYAGKFADKESSSVIYPEHVRYAKANIEPSLLRATLEDMTLHKLFLLLAITRRLRYTQTAYVTTGEVEENYRIVCEEHNENPRKHTQIWEYLKEFEKYSILVTKKSSVGHRGNTQLISIQDASVSELEQEVIKRLRIIKKHSTILG
ncbi:MAG: ORC1-type DNA replication protein [Candidatus Kariarchaeaceae archaeon]|jgi:cell division control protein 6